MIAVSYLTSKLSEEETIKKIDECSCDYIHADLIDGLYCGNNNIDLKRLSMNLKEVKKPIDVHLMVNNPLIYMSDLLKLNVKSVAIHLHTQNIKEVINLLHQKHILVGIALNPDEEVSELNEYLNLIDYVLVMSVYPGKGGQKFIKEVISKIKYFNDLNIPVNIDGGINDESVKELKGVHLNTVVVGSYITMNDDYDKYLSKIKECL